LPECARPTGGSHGRTARGPAQRGEGARRRAGGDALETPARKWRTMGRIEHALSDGTRRRRPNRPKTFARKPTIPQKVTNVSTYGKGPEPRRGAPALGNLACYSPWSSSPRCLSLILGAVVALMYSRARGGTSSITRRSSASVSRTSTHSSAYRASLASPSRLFAVPYRPSRSFGWGPGHPEGYSGPLLARPTSENAPSTHSGE
jgi:hypothetical protein